MSAQKYMWIVVYKDGNTQMIDAFDIENLVEFLVDVPIEIIRSEESEIWKKL